MSQNGRPALLDDWDELTRTTRRPPIRARVSSRSSPPVGAVLLVVSVLVAVAAFQGLNLLGSPTIVGWGPVAVFRSDAGMQARNEGTLVITPNCTFLERNGERALLAWPATETTWDAASAQISFMRGDGQVVTVRNGEHVVLGGGGSSRAEDGLSGEAWANRVTWVAPPKAACLVDERFLISDVIKEEPPTPVVPSANPAPPTRAPTEPAQPSTEPSKTGNEGCGRVVATADPRGSASKPLAVFESPDGLSLYDIKSNAVTGLDRTDSNPGRTPRFRAPSLVSFVRQREPADDGHTFGQDSMYELDIERKQAEEMIRLPSRLLAFDWSPDGMELAYLIELGDQSDNRLCTLDIRSGAIRSIRSFSYTVGRGGDQWDEVSVAWAPTARRILVLHTITEQPSIHVVDIDGRDVAPPQVGTFARWLGDDTVLFLEGSPQATLRPWQWFSLSIVSGQKREAGLPDEGFRPALSPDGDLIAFDDGAEEPSIYVFDIATGTSRLLAHDHVAPVWLGQDLIAATAAGPCPSSYFCVIPWLASDTTIGIEPTSGDQLPLSLTTTLQGYAFSGAIDVLLPATGR